jgi:hypothetical protein
LPRGCSGSGCGCTLLLQLQILHSDDQKAA